MLSNILLTGATGFVGRNLLGKLASQGCNVRCIVRSMEKSGSIKKLNPEIIVGDITKKKSVISSMKNIDVVIHLAAMVNVSECIENPAKAFETNTIGVLNMLEESRKEACKSGKEIFYIYLSSDRVYGSAESKIANEETPPNPLDPYSVSKLNGELILKSYNSCFGNIHYIILRSANIYGHGQSKKFLIASVIDQILRGKKEIQIGNLGYYRNFVYIDDLIGALAIVLDNKEKCSNQVLNISESSQRIGNVVDLIRKISMKKLNRDIKFVKRNQLSRIKSAEFNKLELDCSKISKIGWGPKMRFEEGIEKTFQDCLEEK